MLDLETLGTLPTAEVATIGVVAWLNNTSRPEVFYRRILFDEKKGESLTMEWWKSQSEDARKELFDPNPVKQKGECLSNFGNPELSAKMPIRQALLELTEWVRGIEAKPPSRWWSQGSAFDFPILENQYRLAGLPIPWKFWMVRDTRTVFDICDVKHSKSEGVHHAVADCLDQIATLKKALE